MDDLVSIIVPAYNCEKTIKHCINSLLEQTYHNIEIIVIDDGSTDCTGEIVSEIGKCDSRVQYYFQENSGVSAARNYGLKVMKGNYVCFCDSDDYFDLKFVEKSLEQMVQEGADIVSCNIYVKNGEDIKINKSYKTSVMTVDDALDFYGNHYYGACWGKLYRSSLIYLSPVLCFDSSIYYSEDELFWVQVALRANTIVFLSDALYYYVISHGNASSSINFEKKMTRYNAWQRIVKITETNENIHTLAKGKLVENMAILFRELESYGYNSKAYCDMKKELFKNLSWYEAQSFASKKIIRWVNFTRMFPDIVCLMYKLKRRR